MSKPLWNLLLILTGCLALWRGALAGWDLWQYGRLQMEVPAKVVSFSIIPKGSKYALEGAYTYVYQGHEFKRKTLLSGPYHLNKASAEIEIKKMEGMPWSAWVDARKPAFSSLENNFPYRKIFYGVCLIGIFLYFVYLRLHLQLLFRSM